MEKKTMETRTIDKVVRIGSHCPSWGSRYFSTYARIQFDGKRLSICGVEGPLQSGNALGSCGQISDHIAGVTNYAPGWDKAKAARFAEIWDRWHLNDMRPGCEHQRAENWGQESVEVVTYTLSPQGHKLREQAKEAAMAAAIDGIAAKLTTAEKFLIGPDWFNDRNDLPGEGSHLFGLYKEGKRETKRTGHTYEKEHPKGVLCKPCPVCGYKYGSAWLFEPAPESVIDELIALPETDKTPAWV